MLLTKDTRPLPKKLSPPVLKWQTGHYQSTQEIRFYLPHAFLLLCKLWNTTPDNLLHHFIENVSHVSWDSEGKEEARSFLDEYVIAMGYGQQHYTEQDIRKMSSELKAISLLWPKNASSKMITRHARWRDNYFNWWFKKWYRRLRRKI